ncbi:MAG: hypothetical protein ACRC7W_06660 [Fusobacteriaceae bacterium]
MEKIYIYNRKNVKQIDFIPITSIDEFKENPELFYPPWNDEENLYSKNKYYNPYIENDEVREMTREEKILNGYVEFLFEGEYVENGVIKTIPKPTNLYIPKWNKELNLWQEGATTQDIDRELERLLDEYIELVDKKDKYEKFEFPTDSIYMKMGENTSRRIELIEMRESLGG